MISYISTATGRWH